MATTEDVFHRFRDENCPSVPDVEQMFLERVGGVSGFNRLRSSYCYMGFQSSRGGFFYMLEFMERQATRRDFGDGLTSGWKIRYFDAVVRRRRGELPSEIRCRTAMAAWRDVLAARCLSGNGVAHDSTESSSSTAGMTLCTMQCFKDLLQGDEDRFRYHTEPLLMSVWAGELAPGITGNTAVPTSLGGLHHALIGRTSKNSRNQSNTTNVYAISYKHTLQRPRSTKSNWKPLSVDDNEQAAILTNLRFGGKFWFDGMDTPWDGGGSSVLYGLTAYVTPGVTVLVHVPTTVGQFDPTPLPRRYLAADDALKRALAHKGMPRLPVLWGDFLRSWLLAESFCGAIRGSNLLTAQSHAALEEFNRVISMAQSMAQTDAETKGLQLLADDVAFFADHVWAPTTLPFAEFVDKYIVFVQHATATREEDVFILSAFLACIAYTTTSFDMAVERARHYITRDDPVVAILMDVTLPHAFHNQDAPITDWVEPNFGPSFAGRASSHKLSRMAFEGAFRLLSTAQQDGYSDFLRQAEIPQSEAEAARYIETGSDSFLPATPDRPGFDFAFTDFEHSGENDVGYWLMRVRLPLGLRSQLLFTVLFATVMEQGRYVCRSEPIQVQETGTRKTFRILHREGGCHRLGLDCKPVKRFGQFLLESQVELNEESGALRLLRQRRVQQWNWVVSLRDGQFGPRSWTFAKRLPDHLGGNSCWV